MVWDLTTRPFGNFDHLASGFKTFRHWRRHASVSDDRSCDPVPTVYEARVGTQIKWASGMSRRAQLGVGFRVKFTVEGLHVNVQVEAALVGAVAATSVVVEPAVPQ